MKFCKHFSWYINKKMERCIQLQSQKVWWDSDIPGFQLQLENFRGAYSTFCNIYLPSLHHAVYEYQLKASITISNSWLWIKEPSHVNITFFLCNLKWNVWIIKCFPLWLHFLKNVKNSEDNKENEECPFCLHEIWLQRCSHTFGVLAVKGEKKTRKM